VNFNSEIADSEPHLSAAMRRTGPARQYAAAAWLPRAAPTPRLKAAVIPTASPTALPSAVLASVSRCSSAASRAPTPCHRWLAEQRRRALRLAPRWLRPSRAAPRVAVGHARRPRQRRARGPCPMWPRATPRSVHLGRAVSALYHPVKFIIF
jgi:hypothetical protein